MLNRQRLVHWVFLLIGIVSAQSVRAQSLDPALGKEVAACAGAPASAKKVWIFKQWHLPPGTDSKAVTKPLPQQPNQTAIYRQLERWVTDGQMRTILAEGCEGEIDDKFAKVFNGWSMTDLKAKSKTDTFAEITSHVPMKIEAKFADKVKTLCGDNETMIKQQNLLLSDLRGTVGFLTRLQDQDSKKADSYLIPAIEVFKFPAATSRSKAVQLLNQLLGERIGLLLKAIDERSMLFAQAIEKAPADKMALVIGGLHADALRKMLEERKLACSVVEPAGYAQDEEKLVADLQKYWKK